MTKNCSPEDDQKKKEDEKEDVTRDPEYFSCMLQPSPADSDSNNIGIHRLLLYRKAESGVLCRKGTGDALGKVMWPSAITLTGRGIGKVYKYQATQALLDRGGTKWKSKRKFSSNASDIDHPHKKRLNLHIPL